MRTVGVFAVACVLLFRASPFAQDHILQVGESRYTREDIEAFVRDGYDGGIRVIGRLKEREAVRLLAGKRGFHTGSQRDSLYRAVTGHDYEKDKVRKKLIDLPAAVRGAASTRQLLFNQWVAQIAHERIPTVILDEDERF
jgi:hypothetical protein